MNKKIKVSVITGFLGAGKTTLLNNLITKNNNLKIIVIENEFGEINIDRKLITGVGGNNIYELSNGCLCCTLNNEFGMLLNSLILAGLNCDYLLIETTGVADPGDIIQTFLQGGRVYEYFELASVICVVDAANFKMQLTESEEAVKQVALADVIFLNKIETAAVEELPGIICEITALNSEAEIIKTSYGNIDGFDLPAKIFYNPAYVEGKLKEIIHAGHQHNHNNELHHSLEITSCSFTLEGNYILNRFALWLDVFLMYSKNIFRVKGIINIEGEKNRYILQAVNKTFSLLEGSKWNTDEKHLNEIVFIGKNINSVELGESLKKMLTPLNTE